MKMAPFLLMGIGGIGFGHWCVAGRESPSVRGAARAPERHEAVTGFAVSSGVTAKEAAVHAPGSEPWEAHGDFAMPMHPTGKVGGGVAWRKDMPIAADWVRAVPSSQSETSEAVSASPRTRTGRSFTIPAALADRPLPVFIRFSGAVEESAVTEGGTLGPSLPGVAALPSSQEQRVLAEAERIFADAMDQSPVQEATAPEYEDWWRAAQARSENYLRLSLGWDRFNTLTRAELKSLSDPSPPESLPSGAMESAGE